MSGIPEAMRGGTARGDPTGEIRTMAGGPPGVTWNLVEGPTGVTKVATGELRTKNPPNHENIIYDLR